mmetsp:Transcript_48135/g.153605  ORF Transcript_48135/g.153605 Transcript_48135/m.153605 type:complete len:529 (+) Transcript_48135:23-1609(+)
MAACLVCAAPQPTLRCEDCGVAAFCSQACRSSSKAEHTKCRGDWRPISVDAITAEGAAQAAAAGERAGFAVFKDAEVQALVLQRLGFREEGALVGQRPLEPQDIIDMVCAHGETLALGLFGRNSFSSSYLPMLRGMTSSGGQGVLKTILSRRVQGFIYELPTLELCAALCTRILCVARRLQKAKKKGLLVLGVGSGDALVEASVALHLGAVLQQPVDLSETPISIMYDQFRIELMATDTADVGLRTASGTAEALTQMPVEEGEVPFVVSTFAELGAPLYVLCSWQPADDWLRAIERAGGEALEEICFLQPPPSLRQDSAPWRAPPSLSEDGVGGMEWSTFRRTELFPKTLSRLDFLGHGFKEQGHEVGFYHSQLYIYSRPQAALPYLHPILCHSRGPYDDRVKADRALQGVHAFHDVGLVHACCPDDLREALPDTLLTDLKDALYTSGTGEEVAKLRNELRRAQGFAEDRAHKQLGLLIKNSAQRMYQKPRLEDVFKGRQPALPHPGADLSGIAYHNDQLMIYGPTGQ